MSIVVSREVRDAITGADRLTFQQGREVFLKGIREPVCIYNLGTDQAPHRGVGRKANTADALEMFA
jgi:class 3 adenylate cyclase